MTWTIRRIPYWFNLRLRNPTLARSLDRLPRSSRIIAATAHSKPSTSAREPIRRHILVIDPQVYGSTLQGARAPRFHCRSRSGQLQTHPSITSNQPECRFQAACPPTPSTGSTTQLPAVSGQQYRQSVPRLQRQLCELRRSASRTPTRSSGPPTPTTKFRATPARHTRPRTSSWATSEFRIAAMRFT